MGIFDSLLGSSNKIIATKQKELDFLESAKSGNIIGVKAGLQNKVNINIRSRVGNSALWIAACKGHFDVCEFLLQNGADPFLPDSEGTTAFTMAYHSRNSAVLELFEKHIGKKYKRW